MRAKARFFYFLLLIFFLQIILVSAAAAITRIMPLGDSITKGYDFFLPLNEDGWVGYREKLYSDLIDQGYEIDFVGSQDNGFFTDPWHEGHGGWQASGGIDGGLVAKVFEWLTDNPADIVLLHIGTNDIDNGETPAAIVSQVELILDEIFSYDPEIIVILAQIINRQIIDQDTTDFNNLLPGMINAHPNRDNIFLVDQENALTYPDDLGDSVHPNETGYNKMADVWFDELEQILPDPDTDQANNSSSSSSSGCFIGTITE